MLVARARRGEVTAVLGEQALFDREASRECRWAAGAQDRELGGAQQLRAARPLLARFADDVREVEQEVRGRGVVTGFGRGAQADVERCLRGGDVAGLRL